MTESIDITVQRHERLLYGNGDPGLKGKVDELSRYMTELKDARKEEARGRQQILVGVSIAVILQLAALVVAVIQHIGA